MILFVSRDYIVITDGIPTPSVMQGYCTIGYGVTCNDPVVEMDVDSFIATTYRISGDGNTNVIAVIRVDTRGRILVKSCNYIV